MRLEDRVAIATGADSGIGQATAEAFAREGADVAITYFKDADGAEETRRRIEDAGGKALVARLDQRDPAEVEALFRKVESEFGAPFILVNNAGIDSTGKEAAEMSIEDWDAVIRTNHYGPFYC